MRPSRRRIVPPAFVVWISAAILGACAADPGDAAKPVQASAPVVPAIDSGSPMTTDEDGPSYAAGDGSAAPSGDDATAPLESDASTTGAPDTELRPRGQYDPDGRRNAGRCSHRDSRRRSRAERCEHDPGAGWRIGSGRAHRARPGRGRRDGPTAGGRRTRLHARSDGRGPDAVGAVRQLGQPHAGKRHTRGRLCRVPRERAQRLERVERLRMLDHLDRWRHAADRDGKRRDEQSAAHAGRSQRVRLLEPDGRLHRLRVDSMLLGRRTRTAATD